MLLQHCYFVTILLTILRSDMAKAGDLMHDFLTYVYMHMNARNTKKNYLGLYYIIVYCQAEMYCQVKC